MRRAAAGMFYKNYIYSLRLKKAMSTELLDETNLPACPVSINQLRAVSLAGLGLPQSLPASLPASIWRRSGETRGVCLIPDACAPHGEASLSEILNPRLLLVLPLPCVNGPDCMKRLAPCEREWVKMHGCLCSQTPRKELNKYSPSVFEHYKCFLSLFFLYKYQPLKRIYSKMWKMKVWIFEFEF